MDDDVPLRVVRVEETPNPNARKFVLDRAAFPAPLGFRSAEAAAGHPVASRLFAVEGVVGVLLLGDFVTVNKAAGATWRALTPSLKRAIAGSSPSPSGGGTGGTPPG